jgi:hypothetical protein
MPSGNVPLKKLWLTSSTSSRRSWKRAVGNSPEKALALRLRDVSVGASSRAAVVGTVPERLRRERSIPTMSPVAASQETPGHAHQGGACDRVAPADAAEAYVQERSAPAGSCSEDLRDSSARRGSGADDAAVVMVSRGRRSRSPPWSGSSGDGEEVVPVTAMAEKCEWEMVTAAVGGERGGGSKMEAGKVVAHW